MTAANSNDKLKQFLDDVFRPYGDFPARKDVEQELLANLNEKYNDLKADGKTDDEAYKLTVESFGDVSEIMEYMAPSAAKSRQSVAGDSSRFRATALQQADLGDTNLAGGNFSMSALNGANFDKSDLRGATFKAAALKGASFVGADLTNANFDSSDLTNTNLQDANFTGATLKRCAFKGASFSGTTLDNADFKQSDLTEV